MKNGLRILRGLLGDLLSGLHGDLLSELPGGSPKRTTCSATYASTNSGTTSNTRRLAGWSIIAIAALGLSACGGGGGGGGGFLGPSEGDETSYTLELVLVDANGNPTTIVSGTFPGTLLVTVREATGQGNTVSGAVVVATAQFATIAPENGQSLTDADGVAEFQITGGDTLGADTITVTVESPAGTVTATIGVEIANVGLALGFFDGNNFVLGRIGLSSDSLSFRGTSVARVAVVDESGTTITSPEQVRFTSDCSLSGQASFREIGSAEDGTSTLILETVDGLISVEYLAGSCTEGDVLTAELVNGDATATATLAIAAQDASFVGFVSAEPAEGEEGAGRTIIALDGTGGPDRPEIATIVFEVLEEAVVLEAGEPGPGEPGYFDNVNRAPLSGVTVNFALSNDIGGATLLDTSAVTNANGLVEVQVKSGSTPTSVRVVATIQ